jgi:hypothetical protein
LKFPNEASTNSDNDSDNSNLPLTGNLVCAVASVSIKWIRAIPALAIVAALAAAYLATRPVDSVRDGVFTLDQARRGEALYPRTCLRCHGADLTGDGFETPPLAGSDFIRRWSGQTVADLFQFVSENMPRNQPGDLESQVYIDLIAYILRYNGYPTGNAELFPNLEKLASIRIEPR